MESDNFLKLEEKVKIMTEKLVELSAQQKAKKSGAKDAAPLNSPEINGGLPAETVGRIRDSVHELLHVIAEL